MRAWLVLGVVLVLAVPSGAGAQAAEDSLAAASSLYAAAAYEDALSMLDRLGTAAPTDDSQYRRDIQLTRALCLVALNREAEARQAMEALVDLDPRFDLSPTQASPRVRDMLRRVRVQRLPEVIRKRYAVAKQHFDARDYRAGTTIFAEVQTLLDDPLLADADPAAGLNDLRTLVGGFSELSAKLQAAELPSAAPVSTAELPPSSPPPERAVGALGTGPEPAVTGTNGRKDAPRTDGDGATAGAGSSAATPAAGGTATSAPVGEAAPVPAGATPDGGRIVAPVAIEQQPPVWSPQLGLVRGQTYRATVEVSIDASGKVTSARILQSVNRLYDSLLLDAVRRWRYQPGTRNGVPIPFTKVVSVTVEARDNR